MDMVTSKTGLKKAIIKMPRLNANEDEASIVSIDVAEGGDFDTGQLLFVLETTKAATEVEAPCSGTINKILVSKGDMVAVGAPICEAMFESSAKSDVIDFEWADEISDEAATGPDKGLVKISTKARMIAQKAGVDIDTIPAVGGAVRISDVEAFIKANKSARKAGPLIRARYSAQHAVVFGGGGHARAIIDLAQHSGLSIIGGVDGKLAAGEPIIGSYEVLGDEQLLADLYDKGVRKALVGVGGAVSNKARAKIYQKLIDTGFELPSLVSKAAVTGLGLELGAASYIFGGANVGPAVSIGDNCIINQNAVIAHDSRIGDHVHLAPNAVIAGHCDIGEYTTIGMCATVINGARVGSSCLVHNTVAVTQNISDSTIVTANTQLDR